MSLSATLQQEPPLRFRIRDARPEDRGHLLDLLLLQPTEHLYPLAWLERALRDPAERRQARLLLADTDARRAAPLGLCLLLGERMAVPVSPFPQVARAFGDRLRRERCPLEHITGERDTVDALWDAFAPDAAPRLSRLQRAYLLHRLPEPPPDTSTLRLANLDDLPHLLLASADLYREETLSDPARTAPLAFQRMICDRILQRQIWICTDERGVSFKAELALRTPHGALLAGVYTRPDARRRGLARQALLHLLHRLQAEATPVALLVNADNHAARTLYERLGFRYTSPWRTLFVT